MTPRRLHVAEGFSLPVEFVLLASVVYGTRGVGKTYLGGDVAEEAHAAGVRFCVVDLKGDWWGLKAAADGKAEGLPVVVFGGDHADVPLDPTAGRHVAEIVARLPHSVILDLEHLSKAKQVAFLADFFERLYDVNREPLLLLLDEAQRYAPQLSGGRAGDPQIGRCLGAVEDLVKLGRKHGIGVMLFSQRGAGLNKEVSELCDVLIVFRTPGVLDQKRVKEWLDANATEEQRAEVTAHMAGLATGRAVFASAHPDLKLFTIAQVRPRRTFDSSATPKVGQRRQEPKRLAAPDLDALKSELAEAIEAAEAEDPVKLKERARQAEQEAKKAADRASQVDGERVQLIEAVVREVERAGVADPEKWDRRALTVREALGLLDDLGAAAASKPEPERVEVPVVPKETADALARAGREATEAFASVVADLRAALERVPAEADGAGGRVEGGARIPAPRRPSTPVARLGHRDPPPVAAAAPNVLDGVELRKGERKMLAVVAEFSPIQSRHLATLCAMAYSKGGGTFGAYLRNLKRQQLVEEAVGGLVVTPQGLAVPNDERPPGSTDELLEDWALRLRAGERAMLAHLVAIYPGAVGSEELAEQLGISYAKGGGTFGAYLRHLKREGLAEAVSGGVAAGEALFLPGVPAR